MLLRTILGLLVLFIMERIPAPYWQQIYAENPTMMGMFDGSSPPIHLLSLGLSAFLSSYLLIEILSLFIPALKEARLGGRPGRERLNRLANRLGIAMLLVHGYMVLNQMHMMTTYSTSIWSWPYLVSGLSMVVASVIAFILCRWISRQGMIEGYCGYLFVGTSLALIPVIEHAAASAEVLVPVIIVTGLVIAGIVYLLDKRVETSAYDIPVFPQSIESVYWAAFCLQLPITLSALFDWSLVFDETKHFGFKMGLIALFSIVGALIFSAYPRVKSGLLGIDLPADYEEEYHQTWKAQVVKATCILLACTAVFFYLSMEKKVDIPMVSLIILSAIGLDFVYAIKFWRGRDRESVVSIDLDNLHAVNYLVPKLRSQEIPHFVMGHRFRSLVFWMVPFVKMAVFVPKEYGETVDDLIGDLRQQ